MELFTNPLEWLKKYGPLGFLFFVITSAFSLVLNAIIEHEVQKAWDGMKLQELLLLDVVIRIPVIILLLVCIISILAIAIFVYYNKSKPQSKLEYRTINPKKLEPPRQGKIDRLTTMDVIATVEDRRRRKKSDERAARVVEDGINQSVISPKLGAELADEFGYIVTIKPNGKYLVEKAIVEGGAKDE